MNVRQVQAFVPNAIFTGSTSVVKRVRNLRLDCAPSSSAIRAPCPRLYRARRRAVDPVLHLAPGPVLAPAVAQVHLRVLLQVLLQVFCPLQDRVHLHLPVLSLVRRRVVRPVLPPVLTRALLLVQVRIATSQ
jgi:hypothetical protein